MTAPLLPTSAAIFLGAINTGGRWYMGREWDRVFDVEMDSGLKLKLALDNGENPYIVADRFLEQHDLPQEFKEQVGAWVELWLEFHAHRMITSMRTMQQEK
jgi:hypothetical protein